jgi:hypothetical protein
MGPPVRLVGCGLAAAALALALSPLPAAALTATATISGGPLAVAATPLHVTPAPPGGAGQTTTIQTLEVSNATGSGAGWSITASATAATAGGATGPLPPAGELTVACLAGNCHATAAPIRQLLPTAPAAEVLTAGGASGAGRVTVELAWTLAAPVRGATQCTVSVVTGP